MKKHVYLLLSLFLSAAVITSCEKDKKSTPDGEKFSALSVEENKATLEDAGIELVSTMSEMETIESVGVIINFGEILSSSELKKSMVTKDSKIISTLETFAAAAKGEKKVNDVFHAMISPSELSEDPESIQEFWDENVGTYEWNPSIEDWDITYGGTRIIFMFPSEEGGLTNDAALTISNYQGINIPNPIDDEYTGDLPLSLNADLKVGSKTLVTMTFAAAYNDDGVPNSVASDLTIESYKFEVDIVNNTNQVSANYKFTNDGEIIMEMGASGSGLFTEDNFDDNTETITHTDEWGQWEYQYNPLTGNYDEVWVEYTDTWEETETEFEEILNSASAHFQLFDIAIRGDIDVKGVVDQIRLIDESENNEEIDEEEAENQRAEKINEFMNLRVVNVTTNEIMAKAEAYVVKEVDEYWEDIYIDFRLKFSDESYIDLETYFEEGFDDFVDEMNSFINDVNSDYDMDLEPIEY